MSFTERGVWGVDRGGTFPYIRASSFPRPRGRSRVAMN